MPQIPDRTYGEIASELDEFESYLSRLEVQPLDRLRGAIANIREIEKACSGGRAKTLETDPRLPELVWSLVEGAELAEIFWGIRDYYPAIVKKLMRKALTGPLDPKLETASTNLGRNTVFELRLGAGFRLAGASVTMGGIADLSIDHAGFRLYVECKRPLGEQNICAGATGSRTRPSTSGKRSTGAWRCRRRSGLRGWKMTEFVRMANASPIQRGAVAVAKRRGSTAGRRNVLRNFSNSGRCLWNRMLLKRELELNRARK